MRDARRPAHVHPAGLGYWAIRGLAQAARALLTRTKVSGRERVPPDGGILIVSNHLSMADPVVLITASPRPLVFMAKEEIYRKRLARLILDWWGASFEVRRGQNDIGAVRDALELVRAGCAVVVFPEGTRSPEGLGPAHPGISYLASRAGCPVMPVAIMGTERIESFWSLFRIPSIEVRFGEPFVVEREGADSQEVVALVMGRIAELLPPERRGLYAAPQAQEVIYAR